MKATTSLPEEPIRLPQVSSIINLTGKFIAGFSGTSYKHSVQLAEEWATRNNTAKNQTVFVTLKDYYPQLHSGKSIIVSYNREENNHIKGEFYESHN